MSWKTASSPGNALCLWKLATLGAAICAVLSTPVGAQTWPQRNVRFILPFGTGTATDVSARLLGERLGARWGKPVIVDNRPGGDGLIAMGAFVAAQDDHVLLFASTASFLAHPYTQEKLPYNLERDLAPIARLTDTVLSVGVPAASATRSVADFVRAARALPGKYNAAGAAGLPEFTMDAFLKSEKLDARKVPYKDVVQAARDLAEDRIQFLLSSVAVVRTLIDAGRIRSVAIAARQRSPLFKDIPSVVEAGYPLLAVETTAGLYGPRGMPLELRRRIGAEVIEAINDPAITAKIAATGQDVRTGGPEELAATLRQQTANTTSIAKILGMPAIARSD
ncbi:MAG: tripartite tricarboxylate transporter substrate binding protein [Burkholderiales bacterium]|nr:tripartite tricarboxylate transporter substrate binding protein [Burkholderiales bacterium]